MTAKNVDINIKHSLNVIAFKKGAIKFIVSSTNIGPIIIDVCNKIKAIHE